MRVVLLLLVVAGLFTMHTIGHHGVTGHVHEMPPAHAQSATDAPDTPAMPLGSIAVCVAILCGLTLLAVAALLARRAGTWRPAPPRALTRIAHPVRGPPGPPIGLRLADLSVARN